MSSDVTEAEYYTGRLQTSLEMAAQAVNTGAMMAHQGLAACYRSKLASLSSVEAPRKVLSLASFREKKQANDFAFGRTMESVHVSAGAR